MTAAEGILIAICGANTIICGLLAFRFSSFKSALKGLEIVYFTETRSKDGFIKKETNVQIKGQLFLAGLPIGHAFMISEQVSEEIDKEKINRILEDFAKPLATLGLRVITKKLL